MLGGADLAAAIMRHDLIDEHRIYVHPIVIGQGKPLFQPSDTKILRLAETRTFGSAVVLLRYQRPVGVQLIREDAAVGGGASLGWPATPGKHGADSSDPVARAPS